MSSDARLLVFGPGSATARDLALADLPRLLEPGDVVVLNDAATLPASLSARTDGGADIELRLFGQAGDDPRRWTAVLFGEGDYHTPTEHRSAPPPVLPGDRLAVDQQLAAVVESLSPLSTRLLTIRFECSEDAFWNLLYAHGRPVQYAHTTAPYHLWDVQTPYASRPWAAEMPSAGYHLSTSLLRELTQRRIGVHTITHAAGLSATGDASLDERLPLAERFEIPPRTVEAVEHARRSGRRVVAVGTTVLRALEGSRYEHGRLVAGAGVTDLRIGPEFRLGVADGLLTGIHEGGSSHFRLLHALVDPSTLERAYRYADSLGYRRHELGDVSLVWAKRW